MKQVAALVVGVCCVAAGMWWHLQLVHAQNQGQGTPYEQPAPGTPDSTVGSDSTQDPIPQLDQATPADAPVINSDDALLAPLDPALFQSYAASIETYRQKQRLFVVAKEQWQKVGTLASLEEAVAANREVLVARDAVFLEYFTILDAAVKASQGMELSLKDAILAEISTARTSITTHQEQSLAATDRASVNTQSYTFDAMRTELERIGYSTQAYLHMAKLQTLLDQTQLITDAIEATGKTVGLDATTQAAFDRSLVQLRQEYTSVQAQISELTVSIKGERSSATEYGSGSYSSLRQRSGSVYTKLRSFPSLLSELLGMIP